jgi:TDG/mug DNA glycosylase family protein
MDVLDDILAPELRVVVCGTAVGECAARRGDHYTARGEAFWPLLHDGGLTPTRLDPADGELLPAHGIGLVSLVRDADRRELGFDVPSLAARLEPVRTAWVAFNGKVAAEAVARTLGHRRPSLGVQPWTFAGAEVFVLPSSSGANRRADYDGRPSRLDWWRELGTLAGG